jgi:sugar transferase (PEP-CTERM/EpsH1 system associated)
MTSRTRRPIRVVHVVPSLEPGGLENGVVNVIARSDRAIVSHAVLCLERAGAFAARLPGDVPVLVLGKRSGNDPAVALAAAHAARRLGADVVHTRNWASLVEGALAARLAGARLVHGLHGHTQAELAGISRRRALVEGLLLRRVADRVVTLLPGLRAEALALGVAPGRVAVIENGVDLDRFKPDPEARARTRRELGLKGEKQVLVGCVARLDPVKDHPALLKAFAKMNERSVLVLVGDGPHRPSLEGLARLDGLGDRVRFLGHRSDTEALYPAFDIFALTSRYEGSSNTILEAMAAAVPVVATAAGGTSELVSEETGILVAPGDERALMLALLSLGQDPARRRALGDAGRAAAERRSIAVMARSYEALYAEVFAPTEAGSLLARVRRGLGALVPASPVGAGS